MLTTLQIETLLQEGAEITIRKYAADWRRYSEKTFFYYCRCLAAEPPGTFLPGITVRNYIVGRLKDADIAPSSGFNPHGWFSADWTRFEEGEQSYARYEYMEILSRSDEQPYEYRLTPLYYPIVQQFFHPYPLVADMVEPPQTIRQETTTYRILRDTSLARRIKTMHEYRCQICGEALDLGDGKRYAEAHHLRPLGSPHDGPDVAENIICVCPNHHALLDYGAIRIDMHRLRTHEQHRLGGEYISYHNNTIYADD